MLLRVLALVGALAAGLTSHDWSVRSHLADGRILSAASVALRYQPRADVLRWLSRQPGVLWARLGADGETLDVRFRDGSEAAILPAVLHGAELPKARPFHRDVRMQPAPDPRALVLEPFATELGQGTSAGDPEISRLQAAGFTVDSKYDTQVSVDSMATISGYNVVYMETHTGSEASGNGIVATGQLSSSGSDVGPLLQDGSVIQCTVSGSSALYYCITATYIQNHVGQFPAHSLLFFNGCKLLPASQFWQALQSKGAGVMVSWDNEATAMDNYLTGAAFFNEMGQGMSVSSAISALQAAGYGQSNVAGVAAKLGYAGDGSITLAEAGSAPVSPQSTPVVPTTAPTPVSAPTSAPALPLHLTAALLARVAPGKRQTITILSAPRVVVHVSISFPSGDTRSGDVTTDATGRARYVFFQKPNRVTIGNVFATVVLRAGIGATAVSYQLRYRILWSKIDVSVSPRRTSPGHLVRVWVHTRAHREVVVTLRFPHGRTARFHARTDRSGWAEIPYRVAARLGRNGGSAVLVHAKVHLPRGVFHAFTWFSVT